MLEGDQKTDAVFAAGNAHSDPVALLDQLIFINRLSRIAEKFLHFHKDDFLLCFFTKFYTPTVYHRNEIHAIIGILICHWRNTQAKGLEKRGVFHEI